MNAISTNVLIPMTKLSCCCHWHAWQLHGNASIAAVLRCMRFHVTTGLAILPDLLVDTKTAS